MPAHAHKPVETLSRDVRNDGVYYTYRCACGETWTEKVE